MKLQMTTMLTGLVLCALPSIGRAQIGTFTFESQTPTTFLTSGSTLVAESNPARSATFTVTGATLPDAAFQFVNNADTNGTQSTNLSGITLQNVDTDPNDLLTIVFNQAVTSAQFDFAIVAFSSSTTPTNFLTVAGGGGSTDFTGVFNATSLDFEGTAFVTNATPFTSITIQRSGAAGDYFAIDNLTSVGVSTVPEPGVVALAGAILVPALSLLRRRRSK